MSAPSHPERSQVVKINALTVVTDAGVGLARHAAAREEAMVGRDGFEGCELLRPTDERTTWLIVTRWRDEEAYQAWQRWRVANESGPTAVKRAGGAPRPAAAQRERSEPIQPVAYSESWSYEVAGRSAGALS
jgi:heme oxygenase (mycobilin-producing)